MNCENHLNVLKKRIRDSIIHNQIPGRLILWFWN